MSFKNLLSEFHTLNGAQLLSLLTFILYACLLLLAVVGTINSLRHRQYQSLFLPLFIVVAGSLALVVVMHGETRFKDPLMPYIFMLASSSILSNTVQS